MAVPVVRMRAPGPGLRASCCGCAYQSSLRSARPLRGRRASPSRSPGLRAPRSLPGPIYEWHLKIASTSACLSREKQHAERLAIRSYGNRHGLRPVRQARVDVGGVSSGRVSGGLPSQIALTSTSTTTKPGREGANNILRDEQPAHHPAIHNHGDVAVHVDHPRRRFLDGRRALHQDGRPHRVGNGMHRFVQPSIGSSIATGA